MNKLDTEKLLKEIDGLWQELRYGDKFKSRTGCFDKDILEQGLLVERSMIKCAWALADLWDMIYHYE